MPSSLLALLSLGFLETGRLRGHLQIQRDLRRPFSVSSARIPKCEFGMRLSIAVIKTVTYGISTHIKLHNTVLCIVIGDEAFRHFCLLQGREAGPQEGHIRTFLLRFLPEGRVSKSIASTSNCLVIFQRILPPSGPDTSL